jgi:malate dehydrogenase (oxaloacetate-decarboxylating)
MPTMEDPGVFIEQAADVAMQAIEDGVARRIRSREDVHRIAREDIDLSRDMLKHAMENAFIEPPPGAMLEDALKHAIEQVR